jgi:hypothetical protein
MRNDTEQAEAGVVRDPALPEGAPGALKLAGAEEAPERVRPLRATEVARALLERFAQASDEHASIELTRNAKGDTQIRVAVRDADPDTAAAEARRVYDALTMLYPMAGPSGAESASKDAGDGRQT